jgi:hypothetical protein
MRRLIGIVVLVAIVSGGGLNFAAARRATSAQPAPSRDDMPSSKSGKTKETLDPCCKFCRKGKACGNFCINRTRPCYQAAGCACDAH